MGYTSVSAEQPHCGQLYEQVDGYHWVEHRYTSLLERSGQASSLHGSSATLCAVLTAQ